jgi:hypothetical protein
MEITSNRYNTIGGLTTAALRKFNTNRFLLPGNTPVTLPTAMVTAAKALAFSRYIDRKYRFLRTCENIPLYLLHFKPDPFPITLEYSLYFKSLFHWPPVQRIEKRAAPLLGRRDLPFKISNPLTDSGTEMVFISSSRGKTGGLMRNFYEIALFPSMHPPKTGYWPPGTGCRLTLTTHLHEILRGILIHQNLKINLPWLGLINQTPTRIQANTKFASTYYEKFRSIVGANLVFARAQVTGHRSFQGETHPRREYLVHRLPGAGPGLSSTDIYNYFTTPRQITPRLAAPIPILYRSIEASLTRLIPATQSPSAQWLNRLLTRWIERSTAITLTTHLNEILCRGLIHQTLNMNRLGLGLINQVPKRIQANTRFASTYDESFRSIVGANLVFARTQVTGHRPFQGETHPRREYFIHRLPGAGPGLSSTDIYNYFTALRQITDRLSAPIPILYRPMEPSLPPLSPSTQSPPTQWLNRLLTRWIERSTAITLTTHLNEILCRGLIHQTLNMNRLGLGLINQAPKRIQANTRFASTYDESFRSIVGTNLVFARTQVTGHRSFQGETHPRREYFVHRLPGAGPGLSSTDIYNYFTTLRQISDRLSAPIPILYRPMEPSLTPLSPSTQSPPTQWLNRLLTRWIERSTAITLTIHPNEILCRGLIHQTLNVNRLGLGLINQAPTIAGQHYQPRASSLYLTPVVKHRSTYSPHLISSYIHAAMQLFSPHTPYSTYSPKFAHPPSAIHHPLYSPHSTILKNIDASSSPQSFMHTTAFVTYLHKGNRENRDIIWPAAGPGDEIPGEKPGTEKTAGDMIREPEAPGFEKERLQLRYTFAFSLARAQEAQPAGSHIKNVSILLPAEQWLSSKTTTTKENELSPIEEFWQKAAGSSTSPIVPGSRIIDLQSLADGDYTHPYPVMRHAPPQEAEITREKIMQIEQTIAAQTKQIEKRLQDATRTSPGKTGINGLFSGQQEIKLSFLADGVYKILLDRIKKERSMRGY